MDDQISRRAAIDVLHMDTSIIPYEKAREYANATILEIRNRLEKLPSAQPEIVRCKDCKNIWYSGMATIKGVPIKIYKCDWWDNRVVSEKGFCYMAERKTDE